MKKLVLVFAVSSLLLNASCRQEKVNREATEIEVLEEGPEEIWEDTTDIMEEDSMQVVGDSTETVL